MSWILSAESNDSSSRLTVVNTPRADATPSANNGSSSTATAYYDSGITKCLEISKVSGTQSSQQRLRRRPLTSTLSPQAGRGSRQAGPANENSLDCMQRRAGNTPRRSDRTGQEGIGRHSEG